MKKLIALIMIISLSLCGCISAGNIDRSPLETPAPEITENISPIVLGCVAVKQTNDFINYETIKIFNDKGYTISVKDVEALSNDRVKYDLLITRDYDGKSFEAENFTAMLSYWEENLEFSHGNMFIYGAVANICEEEIILADLNGIRVYDEYSFEQKDIKFDYTGTGSNNMILVDVLKSGDKYWAAYFADDVNQGIAVFDADGNYIDKGLLNLADPEINYFGKYYDNKNYNRPFFMNNIDKMNIRQNTNQVFFSVYTVYDFDEKMYYNVYNTIRLIHDYETIYIERWSPLTKGASDHLRITGLKDGQVKVNKFDISMVEQMYSTEMLTGGFENNVKIALAHENRDLVIECAPINGSYYIDRDTNNIRFVENN